MSDAKSPQDLSMDEILATIRRIIAEDELSSGVTGRVVPGDGPRDTAVARDTAEAGNNVLDLTDVLNDDGSVEHLQPITDALGAPESEPRSTSAETKLAVPTAAEEVPPEAGPRTARPAADEAVSEADTAADHGPSQPATQPVGANDERLVSDVAALAAATAFGRLAAVPPARREPPLVGDRPLDETVRELLRPLLQTWLDENLPDIVERLVQAEIARISSRSGPG